MKKLTLIMLAAFSVATINSFAGDTKPQTKAAKTAAATKCLKGGSCCKNASRAAMMKAKPVKKIAATLVKKA